MTGTVGSGGPHDLGGLILHHLDKWDGERDDPEWRVDRSQHEVQHWEACVEALLGHLCNTKKLMNTHELRRGIESLDPGPYDTISYFGKWAISIAKNMLEKGVLSSAMLKKHLGGLEEGVEDGKEQFQSGDRVRVRHEHTPTRWRKPHIRTPGYIFGCEGVVERCCGSWGNPEALAFRFVGDHHQPGSDEPKQPLYRVRFNQKEVWEHYTGSDKDTIDIEIYQHWLEPASDAGRDAKRVKVAHPQEEGSHAHAHAHSHAHSHAHAHSHSHDGEPHVHEERAVVETTAVEREGEVDVVGSTIAKAVVAAMIENGTVSADDIRRGIEKVESFESDLRGADVVVKAWLDDSYRKRLLEDGNKAVEELGITVEAKLVVVENTAELHNLVVCTLCSCYPKPLLGRPPSWYKSRSYRARSPIEPRRVLQEFGTVIADDVEVRVHDSTADCRYLVLPLRPANTQHWSSDELRSLLTRDHMVGVAVPSL